jgi:uncharacterized protein (TIGR02145 family)
MYQWAEMVQYLNGANNTTSWNPVPWGNVQGICPDGWHLPSDAEFTTLATYLGGVYVAGGKMKETGTTHWTAPNTGATNSSGFTALPGGHRNLNGTFGNVGNLEYYWTTTENTSSIAWTRYLGFSNPYLSTYNYSKAYGFSVRCLQN